MKAATGPRLPAEPRARALELVRRSLPDPTMSVAKMQLPADVAEELQRCRNERAQVYAALEDSSDRVLTLKEEIESSGVVVDVIGDDSSLVVAIEAARESASKAL